MSRTLRVFVIGQSPRPDVAAQILLADPVIRVRVEGALDGMSRDQIASQAPPRSGADSLFTTLSAGETVTVAKAAVVARLLAKLEIGGPALLWSTIAFRELPRRDDFVQPADLLTAMVDVLLPTGTLGRTVPRRERLEMQLKKWSRPGVQVVATALAPHADNATIDAASFQLAATKPDLVLMDCMSYTQSEMARVSANSIVPCSAAKCRRSASRRDVNSTRLDELRASAGRFSMAHLGCVAPGFAGL
jgi:protein AroM